MAPIELRSLQYRNRGLYFLYHIPSFYRQTNEIYYYKSKWTNLLWNYFDHEYSFGSWEQVKLSRVISFITSVQYNTRKQGEYQCLENACLKFCLSEIVCIPTILNLGLLLIKYYEFIIVIFSFIISAKVKFY